MTYSTPNSKSRSGTIQFHNTTFRETNGVHLSRTTQHITRHIDVGNVENAHISTTILKTEDIIIDKPRAQEDMFRPESVATRDVAVHSNFVDLNNMVDVPTDQFDLAKSLALLRSGKGVFGDKPPSTGGHQSSRYGSSGHSDRPGFGAGSSSSVPPQSSESYRDFRSTPFTPFLEKFQEIPFFDGEDPKNGINSEWISNMEKTIEEAQKAGEGQHLPEFSGHTIEHTMLHNGAYINPNPQFQRINGTLEVVSEEHHTVNVNSWNVSNATYTRHTEVKSRTKEGRRKY